MVKKLSFSIENAEMIDENPNSSFAVLSLDFFASGENLHDMYVSEDTLQRTANTIKNCPLVWLYDRTLDDIGTHDKAESPCGFVPESSEIKSRILEDGRTMLSTIAYVWKKYTGEFLNFFKRDGGVKPVSVEMSVYNTTNMANGFTELLDYKFEAITVLGTFVSPAIPLANATVLSFSKEYETLVKKEFSNSQYPVIDFIIPEKVKSNSKKALSENKNKGNSVSVSMAKFISNNTTATPEIVRYIAGNIKRKDPLAFSLMGGKESAEWSEKILAEMNESENLTQKLFTDNGSTLVKNTVEMEMTMDKKEDEVKEMAVDTAKEEKVETPAQEKAESPADEKKEKEAGIEKKFEFPKNFDMDKMSALFADDEEEEIKMAKEEIKKGEFAKPDVVMSGMFARMCKMAELVAKMAEDSKVYMSENEQLKKFKSDVEDQQKRFAVERTMKELSDKVALSPEAKEEMITESEKYSFANIEAWETFCKAKSFEFALKEKEGKSDVIKIGMPFAGVSKKTKDDLWA